MKRYVLGFCFLPHWECILIEKSKPDWQNGLVNGLGGSIEPGETMHEAMVREFYEECGLQTHQKDWNHLISFGNEQWQLNVFRCVLSRFPNFPDHKCDEGEIKIFTEPPDNMEQTARWLYWMCRDNSTFGMFSESTFPYDYYFEVANGDSN